ncbi:scaffolding protein [Bacillus sp. DX4.1]|uniref:phage scaffolding protein n=1 Tax=Bacillus sp. DX4.1 TaxID=3055867 RepID=UPI0025A28224|nr:scaffolding protein [Bacillus sp. DX4.1]MDM5188606.1 scaffolding protein [Bacillus sp. DX4.1]
MSEVVKEDVVVTDPKDETKILTQEQVDEVVAKRLERERKKYEDYDDIKAKLVEFQKAEEERKKQEMSEVERLQAEKEEEAKKALEASELAQKAHEQANTRILNTEIKSVARALNANDPNDVLALLDKSDIKIDEEGSVQGVESAVEALKASKPWMFKQVIGVDASGGSNPKTNPKANELTALEKELAETKTEALRNPKLAGKVTQLYNKILELRSRN